MPKNIDNQPSPYPSPFNGRGNLWKKWELFLLSIFLLSRFWILINRWGESWGFDSDAHRWMLQILSWGDPIVGVRESFFSYHPPLGFLLPRTLMLTGFSDVVSIQLVSFVASLTAFFFLRATLKSLNLLYHPVSLAFLYITASIPLQVYMATSINLDAIILACASATLYCAVRIFWCKNTREQIVRLTLGLIAILTFSILTRFSGLILIAIPTLVALFSPQKKHQAPSTKFQKNSKLQNPNYKKSFLGFENWDFFGAWDLGFGIFQKLKLITASTLISVIALAVASPYYINRYYAQEGVLLPSNNDGWIEPYQVQRDTDRLTFVLNQLFAPLAHAEGTPLEDFDFAGIRLFDTWNSIWARSTWFRAQSLPSIIVSMFYIVTMPFLLVGGLIAYRKTKNRTPALWKALGRTLILFSLLQLLASIQFVYNKPYAPWHPAKAIYIAPVILGIGYLISNNLYTLQSELGWKIALGFVAMFIMLNHGVPVY